MNIDRQLVARAYDKAGEEPITDQEWEEGTGTREILSTFLKHFLEITTIAFINSLSNIERALGLLSL